MAPLRLWILSALLMLALAGFGFSEELTNQAEPIGFIPDGYEDDNPPYYPTDYPTDSPTYIPTDFPTEYPTITIEPTPQEQYGWVSINSVPSGAMVTFDGSYQGQSPVTVQVSLTESRFHQIYISMDGYQDWSTSLSELPPPGQTIPVNAILVPMEPTITPTYTPTWTPTETPTWTPTPTPTLIGPDYGWVSINSVPSGAEVTFDGTYQGSAPALVKVYSTGTPSHQILVRMTGYYDWTSSMRDNPLPDQTIPITATLVPKAQYGSIRVTSNPTKSIAILDGGNQDLTPCTFYDLMPGLHTIKVIKDGYQPFTSQIQVNAGSQSQIQAQLNQITQTGTLYVSSTPSGADIQLDGVYYGQTPYTLSASAGSHTVQLRLAGYNTWKSGVTISAGQQNQISASLERQGPQYGSIQVASMPGSSQVFLNDNYEGKTPDTGYLDLPMLRPGTYAIRISHPQNQDYQGTVAVTAGQVSTVNVALQAAPVPTSINGTLMVNSNPSGAAIFLDNLFKGITPLTLPSVPPGDHTLTLRINGYNDAVRPITITGGNTTDVMIDLVPTAPQTEEPTQTPVPTPTKAPSPLFALCAGISLAVVFVLIQRRSNR